VDLQAIDLGPRATAEVAGRELALESSAAVAARAETPARTNRRQERSFLRASVAIDAMMLGTAAATAELGAANAGVPPMPSAWLVLFPAVVMAVLWGRGMYAPRLGVGVLDSARAIAVSTALAAMGVVSVRALVTADPAAAQQGLRLWAFAAVYLVAGRALLLSSEHAARRRGDTLRPTLIIGAGRVGRLAARRMLAYPEFGLRPVGFLDKEAREPDDDGSPPVLGASWDLERVVREHAVEQVVVTFSKAPHDVMLRLAQRCEDLGVRIAFVPRLFDRMNNRVRVEHVVGLPLISADVVDPKGWQFAVKHVFDRLAAAFLLVLVAPVLLAAAIAVRISLGTPVVFRQARVGRDERRFEMLKFRTLKGALADANPDATASPERRTRVGELLRRTSIDELPQLLNVVRGEMSLVGPRPERPELIHLFADRVNRYSDRHRVKSGITGLAQIHGVGRGSDRFADVAMSERVEWDNCYIQNWSLWLDVKILLSTMLAVLRFRQRV
jgi:exopolysaccharide biosynthesis polyprenyl glycosylphosphotransferase